MSFSRDEIEYAAALSKIELSKEEKAEYSRQLTRILEYVNKLKELNTECIDPACNVLCMTGTMREDKAGSSLNREDLLMNAPDSRDGFIKVPKIIE